MRLLGSMSKMKPRLKSLQTLKKTWITRPILTKWYVPPLHELRRSSLVKGQSNSEKRRGEEKMEDAEKGEKLSRRELRGIGDGDNALEWTEVDIDT